MGWGGIAASHSPPVRYTLRRCLSGALYSHFPGSANASRYREGPPAYAKRRGQHNRLRGTFNFSGGWRRWGIWNKGALRTPAGHRPTSLVGSLRDAWGPRRFYPLGGVRKGPLGYIVTHDRPHGFACKKVVWAPGRYRWLLSHLGGACRAALSTVGRLVCPEGFAFATQWGTVRAVNYAFHIDCCDPLRVG